MTFTPISIALYYCISEVNIEQKMFVAIVSNSLPKSVSVAVYETKKKNIKQFNHR